MRLGAVSAGRIINAQRRPAFDYAFDTNFAADLTVMEETTDFLARLRMQTKTWRDEYGGRDFA